MGDPEDDEDEDEEEKKRSDDDEEDEDDDDDEEEETWQVRHPGVGRGPGELKQRLLDTGFHRYDGYRGN